MKTRAEQLPIEIWISIFHYLEIHDLLFAFNNLNSYFDRLLSSNHLSFHVQLDKCEQFYKQLACFSPWSTSILNRIIYLKSSTKGRGKHISQFLQWNRENFQRLKSLTIEIHKQELSKDSIEFLRTYPIKNLSLACKPNQYLLDGILSSSSLYKCRLYFWQTFIDFNQSKNDFSSNIQILYIKLKDGSNNQILNYLLTSMPKLKRLELVGDHVHQYLTKSSFILAKLERLKLIWLRRTMNIDYFKNLLTIIPNIQYLFLGFYYYRLNESVFDNFISFWWPIFDRIRFIKIIIKSHSLGRTINNKHCLFNDYCRNMFNEINSRTNVYLDIQWIEENFKIHTIQITIQKV